MKKLLVLVLVLLFSSSFIFADSFNDAVESSRGSSKHSEKNSSGSSDDCCSEGLGGCFGILLDESCEVGTEACSDFFGFIWLANNLFVDFTDYPYQQENPNYVIYNSDDGNISSRFSAGSTFFLLTGLGVGNETYFEGLIFPLVGPCIEHFAFTNPVHFTDEYKGNVRLGMELSFLQTNAISIMGTVQWTKWYADAHSLLKAGGISLGLNLKSLPVKPIVLEFKNNWQFYYDNVYVYDHNLLIGVLSGPWEFNIGWKLLLVGNNEQGTVTKRWDGISAGIRFWF